MATDGEFQRALEEIEEILRRPMPMPYHFVVNGQMCVTGRKRNPWEREDDGVNRRDFGQFPKAMKYGSESASGSG